MIDVAEGAFDAWRTALSPRNWRTSQSAGLLADPDKDGSVKPDRIRLRIAAARRQFAAAARANRASRCRRADA
ncbi:MAG: hypothetical protein R3F11_27750 [Verrucomicrobiales bacterium]